MKPFQVFPSRRAAYSSLLSSFCPAFRSRRIKRYANSTASEINRVSVATWNANPAIIRLTPVSLSPGLSSGALDVIAPPAPCRIRAKTSQETKTMA